MDRATVVKRIEQGIEASPTNSVEFRLNNGDVWRVRYDETRKEYTFDEKSDKGYVDWATQAWGDSVNDDDIISWMRAIIGQFKEPIWDRLLPDPKKKASAV